MPSDYAAIREANKAEYGNVGRWGRDVLVNRYDSSAHFIFEILQNAEDALKRRNGWKGSREVRFDLASTTLRIGHFGNPFSLDDVRGVCGVGETTKDLTDIGRFGIGFKSVYSITERPEVHSGEENFAIENFVFPVEAPPTKSAPDQTEFVLPLRTDDMAIRSSVADGLSKLGPRTLLFLRQIEEISWSVDGGASGMYLKGNVFEAGDGGRRVTLIGERNGKSVTDETWLVFSREARTDAGVLAGYIEIAFLLRQEDRTKRWTIQRVDASPLNAFFPTVVTTHLGFLVQGPYRTTPSRDNVPPRDPWNVKLVAETAALLVESLEALKSQDLLDVAALQSLPLERANYPEGSMFSPLFDAVRTALASKSLLPCASGSWIAAKNARLARTQELRDLFDSKQLAALLHAPQEVHWLSGEITRDTASTLRNYLLYELEVTELTPEQVLPWLDQKFMQAQPDEWILRLYEFLGGQAALVRQGRVGNIPLVRLESGGHVVAELNGQPQAFLPSNIKTDFPTVRRSVCSTARSLELLKGLGLTEPDAVDDVVRNILPKYKKETVEADGEEYEADIRRIVDAFGTQLRGQRDKLVAALKEASFVMSVDAKDGAQYVSRPGDVYLATDRLKELFAGVEGVFLVDDAYTCLRGEDVRELLEACGATRYLQPIPIENDLTWEQRTEIRRNAGLERSSRQHIADVTLRGLNALLDFLPRLEPEACRHRTGVLWEALSDVESRRGSTAFVGVYTWGYSHESKTAEFDAAFVRQLNTTAWVPDATGESQPPGFITFDALGWKPNPFLQSKIRFKPPIIETLAKEAGIDPAVLDLLKRLGLTLEQLKARLGIGADDEDAPDKSDASEGTGPGYTPGDALGDLIGDQPDPVAPEDIEGRGGGNGPKAGGDSHSGGPASGGVGGHRGGATGSNHHRSGAGGVGGQDGTNGGGHRTVGEAGSRTFHSYVAVSVDEEEKDPDNLSREDRDLLEEAAILLIISEEPDLQRTPKNNPGFDLYAGPEDHPTRWVEIKAMKHGWNTRPVGMSVTQFEFAQEQREAYWLYVVENAGTPEARVQRVQDPAGWASTFTFDNGWRNVASVLAVASEPSAK